MLSELVLFFCIIVIGTLGELCVTRAMKTVGEAETFMPHAWLATIARAFAVRWMWIGFAMMALAYFALLGMLARANVSFVIPVTALSYVVGAVGGRWFLGEQVTRRRWVGISLVCIGVAMVYLGRG
jgi:drug/metabolite transporter (DMT)-like permease